MPVPKMIETHQLPDCTFRVKWMLPDGQWNQVAFMSPSLDTAQRLEAELKAGLRDLETGELLSEGVVPVINPCSATDIL